MNSTPLISIGIPTYNRPIGLEKVIKNFLNQTYKNIEIVISNNDSEDPQVVELCEKFKVIDNRIKCIHQPYNIGMYENFKFVLKMAKGEFFMWASDDDIFYQDYIEKTLQPFYKYKNIVLCSPACKVLKNDKEINKYNADFQTTGLCKVDRIKKILNYIKKSHTALYGLYKTSELKKITIHSYLDADGLILLELSQYGEYYQLEEELMCATYDYNENDTLSLTHQKKKLIDTYNMRPKFFLKYFEKPTMMAYYIYQLFKWKNLTKYEKTILLPYFYYSFYSELSIRPYSVIKNAFYFLKNRIIIGHFSLDENNINQLQELLENHTVFSKVIITVCRDFNSETIKKIQLNNKQCNNKFIVYQRKWDNQLTQYQYTLNYVKLTNPTCTHLVLINHMMIHDINHEMLLKPLRKIKYNSKPTKFKNDIITIPIRRYLNFSSANKVTTTLFNYDYY